MNGDYIEGDMPKRSSYNTSPNWNESSLKSTSSRLLNTSGAFIY
jgi:hypothetical protein